MAVTRYVGNIIRGNTADTKPTDGVLDGSLYFELDGDKRVFEIFGGVWEELIGEDIEVVDSIEIDEGKIRLVGDEETPGNNKVYGTNASGERTWKDDPSGGGGGGGIDAITTETTGSNTTVTTSNAAMHVLTMTGNLTATIADFPESSKTHRFILKVIQDGSGGRTLTISGNVLFPSGSQPSNSESAGAIDL